MERRQSSRVPASLTARLTVLDANADPASPPPSLDVTVEQFSGNGVRLWSLTRFPLGTLVKLELEDDLFLGEVRHCAPHAAGFHTGIHLDCALASLSGIRALMRALLQPGSVYPSGRTQTVDPNYQGEHQQRCQSHQQNPA